VNSDSSCELILRSHERVQPGAQEASLMAEQRFTAAIRIRGVNPTAIKSREVRLPAQGGLR
jgi:hypothetical protein